jgi:hypothetical protein
MMLTLLVILQFCRFLFLMVISHLQVSLREAPNARSDYQRTVTIAANLQDSARWHPPRPYLLFYPNSKLYSKTSKNLYWPFVMCRFSEDGDKLHLVHKTQVDGIPSALGCYQGRLLAGLGNTLRIYDLGKKKLLRKCENKHFPNTIVSIRTYGDRIYIGDIQESFHFVKYRKEENQLYIFADDVVPRWLTTSLHMDFDTMAGADKFGNVFMARLPQEVSEEIEDDPTGQFEQNCKPPSSMKYKCMKRTSE